ncbi:Gfo/Idh/MocA family oxidoreductase [Pricia sp. S334]|uniref:Gfo/Idh/MocA family oxidoreductase n=1 Tax=Pricia mediterranea TaxID=3076079 RepID=A0ABU3L828_9FLAO|nr:Gfo/Idh/MocA family oxidoreductase [Pricia sp. S334]MDT7829344.1 Gfo/Idh/MocA family oxidoreductase [Pricia sp. S334]
MKFIYLIAILTLTGQHTFGQVRLKVAVVGLSHDHAHEIMRAYSGDRIDLLGIAEKNQDLIARYQKDYQVPDHLFFSDTATMLNEVTPDVVMAYNPINEHLAVAEVCLPMKIPLMVEKPLATTVADAEKMAKLARDNDTYLLTNFETTWYASNQRLKTMVGESAFGNITKMIAKDGHEGPKEIGCSKEFLSWLTDPIKNGGGAVMDFGCYGANLMTWLQKGKRPIAVTAVLKQMKPEVYPNVDDDATITLEYENAIGIIEASWNWSYGIKSLEVYGASASYHAPNGKTLIKNTNAVDGDEINVAQNDYQDHITYLEAVLSGNLKPENDLSSLSNNLIVVEILEAAKKSAETGMRVEL